MKKGAGKLNIRIKINIAIFAVVAVLFAVMPHVLFGIWYPSDVEDSQPQYDKNNFAYVLYDICPCSATDDDCAGYYACGADKANITYNLDTAPEDLLMEAKQASYFESMIMGSRMAPMIMRQYLLCDICYLMAFASAVVGVIYWNHNKVKM